MKSIDRLMKYSLQIVSGLVLLSAMLPCEAAEELVTSAHYSDGKAIPYILNYQTSKPQYVIILFPGGDGELRARMKNGKLVYRFKNNFLIRTRHLIVDDDFATAATDSTQSQERIQAVLDDLHTRFPLAKIYLMSTSNGTFDSMYLAAYLSSRIAGEIHTSARSEASLFDARQYKNRQLFVHHRNDNCRVTPFAAVEWGHEKYGNELIVMEGGKSVGDDCKAFAYHGYNGIEQQTIEAIKAWIKKGD